MRQNWKVTIFPLANGAVRIRTQSAVGDSVAEKYAEAVEAALLKARTRKGK
jgi:hypothetical protein